MGEGRTTQTGTVVICYVCDDGSRAQSTPAHFEREFMCEILCPSKTFQQHICDTCAYFSMIMRLFGSFGLSTKEPKTILLFPSCIVLRHHFWCRHRLCTPLLATGSNIETSHQIFSDSDR